MGIINNFLMEFKAHSMRLTPHLTPLKWSRISDLVSHGTRGKPTTIILLQENINKMIPNAILL